MKIHERKQKSNPLLGYWGNYGEIDIGISSGKIDKHTDFSEILHYHKKGLVYFLILDGEGILEINGEIVPMKKDTVIQIDPEEKYKVREVLSYPLSWITICTIKDPSDKIVLE